MYSYRFIIITMKIFRLFKRNYPNVINLGYVAVIVYDNVERFVMLNTAQWAILVVAIKSFAATSAPLFILSLITRRLGVDKDSFSLFTPTLNPVLSF